MHGFKALMARVLLPGMLGIATPGLAQDPVDEALEAMTRTTLEARDRYREAKRALAELTQGSDAWEQARHRHDEAYDDYKHHWDSLERERIRVLARESGESPHRIRTMREDGMGWGLMARELGVHPGVLGQGHQKFTAKDDDRRHDARGNGKHEHKQKHKPGKPGKGKKNNASK